MPSYNFSWQNFDEETVTALAEACGYNPAVDCCTDREWLSQKVKRPRPEFIGVVKPVLERTWLKDYAGTKDIVQRLKNMDRGPGTNPRSQGGYVEFIAETRNTVRVQKLLAEAMISFGNGLPTIGPGIPPFATLFPAEQRADDRQPFPYQQEAWDNLTAYRAKTQNDGEFRGLLVMPTGSGKTYTAVRWLVDNVVNRNQGVLWIAHRSDLLNQAAEAFYELAGRARSRKSLRVRIVSGEHCSASTIDPDDDILICSIASLARNADITTQLVRESQFIVIDEAHHAPAKSYRDILNMVSNKGKRTPVLGLTATPTRSVEGERQVLSRLFAGNIIFEEPIRKLIAARYLAFPKPVQVKTGIDAETGATAEDLSHMRLFKEPSEEWFDRIASLHERNRRIVEHYCKYREKYGKTLVFAINIDHAITLAEEFKHAGINANYLASERRDGTAGTSEDGALLERFRREDGGLDVLVNIQIMTEGVDVPKIQTVFLTRPTASEILLRQMIGRGLRGPKTGGTEFAYIVSFEDFWHRFPNWERPLDLVTDMLPVAEEVRVAPGLPEPTTILELIPWKLVQETIGKLRQHGIESPVDVFEAVPDGWFVVERGGDEASENSDPLIPVYRHQKPCWDALFDGLRRGAVQEPEHLYNEFFGDCDEPPVSPADVAEMVSTYAVTHEIPEYHSFDARNQCDPDIIAAQISDQDLGERARADLIAKAYVSRFAQTVFRSQRELAEAVNQALLDKQDPQSSTRPVRGTPVFDPGPERLLSRNGQHNLPKLMAEMLKTARTILDSPGIEFSGVPRWTERTIKGWFGKAFLESREIKINCLLNSKDFSAASLRFLLFHEFLHIHLQMGHTPKFRELERKWPEYREADREMVNLNERFSLEYGVKSVKQEPLQY